MGLISNVSARMQVGNVDKRHIFLITLLFSLVNDFVKNIIFDLNLY